MKSIIFDLDNTLYPEETYVESGFREVSNYLSSKYNLDKSIVFSKLMKIFNSKGRGKIFDILLKELDLYSEKNVLLLVYIYRYHFPKIELYKDSLDVLNELKANGFKLGLITDGRSFVQKRKVEALGLNEYFDSIIFTDVLGSLFWKPSTVPYEITLDLLDSSAEESVYVGDDPYKDFLGAHKIGN